MTRTRIKICGITNLHDAQVCAEHGVDAIGLVFYEPSPRYVDATTAKQIVASLPPFISVVALFVNADSSVVQRILSEVPIDVLQFHGDESATYCHQFPRPYIKALRMKPGLDLALSINDYRCAQGILLDTYQPGVAGGTGQVFDWQKIPVSVSKPIILAGGLNVDNVQQAIRFVKPFAVDVSGGVEARKGHKDAGKIINFCREVNCVDNQ